jgi:hypothetical protein
VFVSGWSKLDETCTGHVVASIDLETGVVTCKFCLYHMGHDTDGFQEALSADVEPAPLEEEDASPTTAKSDVEPDVEDATVDVGNEEAADANADNRDIQRVLSQCKQIMAKITAGNYSKDALSAAKKHLRAAYASLQVPIQSAVNGV